MGAPGPTDPPTYAKSLFPPMWPTGQHAAYGYPQGGPPPLGYAKIKQQVAKQPAASQQLNSQQRKPGQGSQLRAKEKSRASHAERKAQWKAKRQQENPGHVTRDAAMPLAAKFKYAKVRAEACCRRCHMDAEEHAEMGHGQLQKHHIVSLRDGGHPTDRDNLVTLCFFCHRSAPSPTPSHFLLRTRAHSSTDRPTFACLRREWHDFWEGEFGAAKVEGEEEVEDNDEADDDDHDEAVPSIASVASVAAVTELKQRWAEYMAARAFREGVMDVCPPPPGAPPGAAGAYACARCAMPAERCAELRPQRKTPLWPFVRDGQSCAPDRAAPPTAQDAGASGTCVCYFCQREWRTFWRFLRPDVPLFFCAPPFRPVAAPRGQYAPFTAPKTKG